MRTDSALHPHHHSPISDPLCTDLVSYKVVSEDYVTRINCSQGEGSPGWEAQQKERLRPLGRPIPIPTPAPYTRLLLAGPSACLSADSTC